MPDRFMSESPQSRQPLTLLVVAAKEEFLYLIKAILTAENHNVKIAYNEDQAFSLARQEKPDVILATCGVHEIGPRLCRRVRQDEFLEDTPFILLTTSSNRRTYSTYFINGCDLILPVPFKCADIYMAINNARMKTCPESKPKIHVMMKTGLADFVEPVALDHLLAEQNVLCFRRSSGVAIVGRDPIRKKSRTDYEGPERRVSLE